MEKHAKLIWILAVFVILLMIMAISSVRADAYRCDLTKDSALCQWGSTHPPDARIIHVPEDHSDAARARLQAWEAWCRPRPEADAYGVVRLRYAHAGCEFGRTE